MSWIIFKKFLMRDSREFSFFKLANHDHIYNKVASFKRSQCEGCSIIIYLMALYDYYLKCIEGRHIKDIFKSSI